jgi:diguanylate cyclase (GGDEF)-like protein
MIDRVKEQTSRSGVTYRYDYSLVKEAVDAAFNLTESDPEGARNRVSAIVDVLDSKGKRVGQAWNELVEAWIDIKRGAHPEAMGHCESARSLFEGSEDRRGYARTLNAAGVILMYINRFDSSLESLRKALGIAEEIGATDLASSICTNIGIVLMETKEWADAARYFEMSEAFGISQFNNVAVFNVEFATALIELGRSDEARERLEKSLGICRDKGYLITEADALGVYGKYHEARGETENALRMYREAVAIASDIGNGRLEAEYRGAAADVLSATGRIDEAIEEFARSAEAARQAGARKHLSRALGKLAELEAGSGRWQEAYARAQEARDAERAIYSSDFATQAALIRKERAQAENEAFKEVYGRLARISEIGKAVAAAIDVEGIGRALYEGLRPLVDFDAFALAVTDAQRRNLVFRFSMEDGKRIEPFMVSFATEDSMSIACIRRGSEIVLNDAISEIYNYVSKPLSSGPSSDDSFMHSMLFHPVSVKGEPFALITVQSRRKGAFSALDGEIVRSLATYTGVALENAKLFEEIKQLAGTDPLTGLMNRRKFFEDLADEIMRGHRYCGLISVIMIDLDHFKLVNDAHGHAVGDLVLKETADVLRRELRTVDKSARFGGEEFVVLLPCTNLEGALVVANRLRFALESTVVLDPESGEPIKFTGSFGVSAARKEESDFDLVLARADKALYAAKQGGRNRVEVER